MKKLISSVLFILLYIALTTAEPNPGRSGGYSRPSPSRSYSAPSRPAPSHSISRPSHSISRPSPSKPSHSYPTHSGSSGMSKPAISHSYPTHSGSSGMSKPAISHSYPTHSGSSGMSRPSTNTQTSFGGSHSYPTSNSGMSGGNKPHTPTFSGTAVSGHSYPTGPITSTNVKPSYSQPIHTTNVGSNYNGGSHITSTNVKPVQNHPSQIGNAGVHGYPTSNSGLSGGNKPNTPFTGTAVGGHSYPTGPISNVNVKPSYSQPIPATHFGSNNYGGSHIGNTGSHGYPASNGGLSGHATNVRPVQNQPFHGTPVGGQPAYPTSNGFSGNSRYPNTGNANTAHMQPTHIQPTYNQPMYNQPSVSYGHVAPVYGHGYGNTAYHAVPVVPVTTYGLHGPIYTTASAGYHPTFVTHSTHSSGSDLNSMLTGLALYNALRSGRSHDHYYNHYGGYGGYGSYGGYGNHGSYGHGNTQNTYNNYYSNNGDPNAKPVSTSQSNLNVASVPSAVGLSNCTLSLSNYNGTDTITIPCEIASTFAVQNTSAPLPAPTSDTKLNCTIAVVKNNGLTEFTQIPCDMITNMAPKPEPPSMRLNCTQSQPTVGSNFKYNPCTIIPSTAEIFPLEVIPLDIKPETPKGPEIIASPSSTPKPLEIKTDVSKVPETVSSPPITETPKHSLVVSDKPAAASAA